MSGVEVAKVAKVSANPHEKTGLSRRLKGLKVAKVKDGLLIGEFLELDPAEASKGSIYACARWIGIKVTARLVGGSDYLGKKIRVWRLS